MLIHIDEVQQGDRLVTDAFNRLGVPLLKQGTILSLDDITLLLRHRLDYVDIDKITITPSDTATVAANPPSLSDGLRQRIELSLQTYQSLFLESLTRGRFSADLTDHLLDPVLLDLDRKKDVVSLLLMLEEEDDHIYSHSLKVGLLSYHIASWLGHSEKECYRISRAGYLHDIGKSRLPSIIRNGRSTMNPSQLKEYRNHTQYGYDLIMDSLQDKVTAFVALQHHERGDGSGYPQRLYKNGIHAYTHIVSVADEFINMSVVNEDGSKQGLIRILQNIYELGFSKLHEQPVQALIYHMSPNLVGKHVELDNGQRGTIVLANQTDLFRPLVQVGEQFIDLAKQRQVNILNVFI